MNNYGLVSIITPSYNSSKFIRETIKSIIAQTYQHWELLITDDCSTDNSIEIVEQFVQKDSRIKLFRLEKNCGAGICRNNSIKEARGRFIAFCDSDDRWYPQKLEKQLAFMLEKQCALSYTSYMICNEERKITGIVVCKQRELLRSMQCNNNIGCLTAIYDVDKVGKMLMPELRKRQDWALWLKILQQCKTAYGMKEPLAIYTIRLRSLSQNKKSLIGYNIRIYREILEWSLVKSYVFCFIVFLPNYFLKRIFQKYTNR